MATPRELTLRVIVLGILLSVVMGAANVYVGLKVSMTVSASIPAAAVAMLVFRTVFRSRSILEANQVQTCASAGESLAAGIIFTMPALVLMEGVWEDFHYWTVTAIAFTGGVLGILFMIPMRRVFVVDNEELPYPEGVACAAVLEAGTKQEADGVGAKALILGALLGGLLKFAESFLRLFHDKLQVAGEYSQRIFYFGSDISPMLVAVGFIVRLNVAVMIFIGGVIGWIISMPLLGLPAEAQATAVESAGWLWDKQVRFIGVGAMVVGGAASIWAVRGGLVQAVVELRKGISGNSEEGEKERDLSPAIITGLGLLCIGLVVYIYYHFTGGVGITVVSTVVMVVMSFFFTAVASYIVGIVGNSNSPVSGMTITAVLFTGGMLLLFGFEGTEGMVAIIGVAAIVCCVACTAGDVCNDLKTGSLVGASPRRQQIMQILGVGVAAFVMSPVMALLHKTDVIGSEKLPAAQSGLFKSLAEGLMGKGEIPWNLVLVGAGIGVAILVVDAFLKSTSRGFRLHLMPVAVGIYLPFSLGPPILLGGLIAYLVGRGARDKTELEGRMHKGVLFSSGVIAGEALTKVVLAGAAVAGYKQIPWDKLGWEPSEGLVQILTYAVSAYVLLVFYRVCSARR